MTWNRPDWKKPDIYQPPFGPRPEWKSLLFWSWQFLRRCPSYAKHFCGLNAADYKPSNTVSDLKLQIAAKYWILEPRDPKEAFETNVAYDMAAMATPELLGWVGSEHTEQASDLLEPMSVDSVLPPICGSFKNVRGIILADDRTG